MDTYVGSLPNGSELVGDGTRPSAPPQQVVRVGQFGRLLRRHLWLIILFAFICGAAAFAYSHTLPRTYTANSTLTVEGDRFAIPQLQGALRSDNSPDPMPYVRTEVQALTSRAMLQSVITQLHLAENAEFNPTLAKPTFIDIAKERLNALIASAMPKMQGGAAVKVSPDELVLNRVSKALSVFQDNRSLVISISFTARDPQLASDFVNTLMNMYVESRTKRRDDVNVGANQVMNERIAQVRSDLAKIEQQMADLRNKDSLVTLRAGGVGQQQLEELTTAAARAATQRSELEVSYDRAVAAAKSGSSDALASVLNSPTIAALREHEAEASQRLAQLSSHYGSNYPGMRSAEADVSAARRQISEETARIVASLGAQLKVARDQEASVQQQLTEARKIGVAADNARAQLDQLQQEANTRRILYQSLLTQAQQTAAQPASIATPDVRILSPAVPPGLPSGPNSKLAGLMGGAGGALLGCLIAVARIRTVSGLETPDEVVRATGINVLATLPRRLFARGRGVLADNGGGDGPDAQAMRTLRGRLQSAGRREAPRAFVFVPATPGDALEASSAAVAASFARVAAADGERVLLIDANLQTARIARLLGQLQAPACDLAALIDGEDWREALVPDRQLGLDLLLPGGPPANSHAMFGSIGFLNIVVETRAEYDMVVIAAPSATSPDTTALVQRADSATLLIDSRADPSVTRSAVARLANGAQTPISGLLLAKS